MMLAEDWCFYNERWGKNANFNLIIIYYLILIIHTSFPSTTRWRGHFAGVHTLLRILLSSNSAVLINIIIGVSPPHLDLVVFYYVLCQC
jgi:hypothetical protein